MRSVGLQEEIAAPLDERQRPQCGQEMEASTELATNTDVPAEPVRAIKRFEVAVGRCRRGQQIKKDH